MSSVLNIALTVTPDYMRQLQVLCSSVLAHHPGPNLHFHIFHHDELAGRGEGVTRLVRKGQARLSFYRLPPDVTAAFPVNRLFPSPVQFLRFFIPANLPPETTRILYLDTDMLVCRPLEGLYTTPLGDMTLAAVPDLDATAACKRLSLSDPPGYFNSGTMLIDVARWLQRQTTPRLIAYYRTHHDHPEHWQFPDQDGLNTVLHREWHELDPGWNLYACTRLHRPDQLSPARADALADPGIIHFTGPQKPWLRQYIPPYQAMYLAAAARAGVRFRRPLFLPFTRDYRTRLATLRTQRSLHAGAGLGSAF